MKKLCGLLLTALILLYSCQKEVSFENGEGLSSEGSLQSDITGDCLPKEVEGTFEMGVDLVPADNAIEVTVNVTKTGPYLIYTDTVNGYFFRASGSFSATGLTTVTLPGNGKPIIDGIDNFRVIYDTSECILPVTVQPAGGGVPAEFTFAGSPTTCMDYTVNGDYVLNVALTDLNTVSIKLNVTTAGTYSLTTVASNGMTFAGQGSVPSGEQFIELKGTGTPNTFGPTTIPISFGSSECSFTINVLATPPVAKEYFPRTSGSEWSYEINDQVNDSAIYRSKPGTTPIGPNTYNIFEIKAPPSIPAFGDAAGYRRDGNNYYTYTDLSGWFDFEDPLPAEIRFLVGGANIGTTWLSQPFTGNVLVGGVPTSFTKRLKFLIVQKDVQTSVTASTGSFSHANTMVVEEHYEIKQPDGTWKEDTFFYKHYYAENIGLVLDEIYDATNPAIAAGKQELRRWLIAP